MSCQESGKRRSAVHAARVGLAEMAASWQDPPTRPGLAKDREKWRKTRHGQR